MIYIANPSGKTRRKKTTKRGSAARRAKSTKKRAARRPNMAKRRRKKKRVARKRRKNPVRRRRVRRRATRKKTPRRRRRKVARKNPRRRRRRRVARRRRRNPRRRRRVARRRRRRNPVRRRRRVARRRPARRRRRRNPALTRKLFGQKGYMKKLLGDAAGITAGYMVNAGLSMLVQGNARRSGFLTTTLARVTNPHLRFAANQAINIVLAFGAGWALKKASRKTGRLAENIIIGGLVRVVAQTVTYVAGVANLPIGQDLLSTGMAGYITAGGGDAIPRRRGMGGYLTQGGQTGGLGMSYSRDYCAGY